MSKYTLKTRFVKLAPLLILAALFVFSGCSTAPRTRVKAGDPVMNTIITTAVTSTTTATTPVFTTPDVPPFDQSNWKITQDQAIAIASQYLPANIASRATIEANMEAAGNSTTGENNYYWDVDFEKISVTQVELGWQSDSRTTLNPRPDGTFDEIATRINAVTGEVVSKTADIAIYLGTPTATPIQLEPTDFTPGSSANAPGIPAYLFWAVVAVCAILIAVIIVMVVRNRRSS